MSHTKEQSFRPSSSHQQLLENWNRTGVDYPRAACIHELFEAQVERTPQSVALVFGDEALTYRELNNAARTLADRLSALGVGAEGLVGICAERSLKMVVGLLGILKAGGAYVPLDPAYPRSRLAHMVADSQMPVILTQQRLLAALPPHQAQVVLLDAPDVQMVSTAAATRPARSHNLAYVIYTSGSTGKPKGVMVEHRNVVNLFAGMDRVLGYRDPGTWLAVSGISFDISVPELFWTLTRGFKVVLQREERLWSNSGVDSVSMLHRAGTTGRLHGSENSASPEKYSIARQILDHQVTHFQCTPSLARILLSTPSARPALRSLQHFCVGGEELPGDLAEDLMTAVGGHVHNMYGPTETTVFSTTQTLAPGEEVTIGRPLANTQTYIINSQNQPAPIGVPGELLIGGDGVARGYLNLPALTSERFVPDSFQPNSGARVYRTGDLARWREDGRIEFLGRIDQQVKIRGHRIELGEIEAVIASHPAVQQCVVVAVEGGAGGLRLATFIVTNSALLQGSSEQAGLESELRRRLREKLPDFMVPDAFVPLEELPLTPNGKIDRKALPAPNFGPSRRAVDYEAPRSSIEQTVAEVWRKVLNIGQIGIRENFFELGGHSLLAMQAVARISGALSVEVPLRVFFELPTIAGLAGWLEEFSIEDGAEGGECTGEEVEQRLSFAQEGLWYLDRFQGGSAEYHIPVATRLRGPLDHQMLERAFNAVVARHESLRTHFVETGSTPMKVVSPALHIPLPMEDLSELAKPAREEAVATAMRDEGKAPFDLSRGPLLRVKLLRLGEGEHILLQTCHHIVSDAWSMGILKRELASFYEAFREGRSDPLPPLTAHYSDHVRWQRERLTDRELDRLLAYWTEKLAGAPPLSTLPTDRPRTAERTEPGESRTMILSASLTRALADLCQREHVTMFMTLLAAFKVLLSRHSGQEDIVVGIPFAGRTQEFTEELIGFFVNTLALRTDLAGNPSFADLLQRMRTTALEAFTHHALPFAKLIEKLQPDRSLRHTPVFQVFFNMQGEVQTPAAFEGIEAEFLSMPEPGAKFDLTLYAAHDGERMQLRAVYDSQLFFASTIERMLERFQILLEAIAADSAQKIGAMPLLAEADRKRHSVEDNPARPVNAFSEFSREETRQSIPARFAWTVERYPARIAVKARGSEWTYAELHHRSNLVARNILRVCGEESPSIALLLDHGASAIAALLGALKAGRTYVALDPSHPRLRLSRIIGNSQARVILTDDKNARLALELKPVGGESLNLDDFDWSTPADEIDRPISPDSSAYLIYTSGSTGMPKGVEQTHRNVLRHIRNYTNALHICAEDRLSLLASYGFDAAVMDIFGALLNGATLLPHAFIAEGAMDLSKWITEEQVTIYHSTPTLYRHLAGTLSGRKNFPGLRLIVLGGEKALPLDVDHFKERFGPDCLFVNGYGPTECTVALQCILDIHAQNEGTTVPVGYPVDDTTVLLLNAYGDAGQVFGEIALRSSGLALGYWQTPELTAAAFQPDADSTSSRIYRTGDLGRLLPNGMIEFVGRRDFQVKVRGHRVELGEIETALTRFPGVAQAAVIARVDEGETDNRLAAYVMMKPATIPDAKALRRHLTEQLPAHMIPSDLEVLDRMPRTPNGKIDRNALPPPASTRRHDDPQLPRTVLETILTGIWKDLLKLESVGVHDNFFELGGHSLLAVTLIHRLHGAVGIEVPLRLLFEHPEIAGFSEAIEEFRNNTSPASPPPLGRRGESLPLPTPFPPATWSWLSEVTGIFTHELEGHLDLAALEAATNELAARHDILRTTFAPDSNFGETEPARPRKLEIIDLASAADAEAQAAQLLESAARRGLDPFREQPLHLRVIRLTERKHWLLLAIHHVAFDAWSMGILFRELSKLYNAFVRGEPSPLPPPGLQFADFVRWRQDWMTAQGDFYQEQISYWETRLRGVLAATDVPVRPGSAARTAVRSLLEKSGVLPWCQNGLRRLLPAAESPDLALTEIPIDTPDRLFRGLSELSQREGVTLFATLLAAFCALLHETTGATDIAVKTLVANRDHPGTQDVIGYLADSALLRISLTGDPAMPELIRRVRVGLKGALAHHAIPFAEITDELRRRGMEIPLEFPVVFQVVTRRPIELSLSGLTVREIDAPPATIPYGFQVLFRDRGTSLAGQVNLNTAVYDRSAAQNFLARYQRCLELIEAKRDLRLSELGALLQDRQPQKANQ